VPGAGLGKPGRPYIVNISIKGYLAKKEKLTKIQKKINHE
jgi:hypothetical protein